MKSIKFSAILAISGLVAGCAQQPNQVAASYVSPSTYDGRSCANLLQERNEIVGRVNQLTSEQKEAATTDAVLTGVALVVFWPAAIGLAATKDNATALSAAKGNYDAITAKMTQKGCALPPEPVAPSPVATEEKKKRSWE
ncbi:hypothetical protein KQ247_19125 [Ruegeria pomeroyi]|jgi:hypothetical protein|uniref:Lipoprotein, putative n=2 Tax=Ruegeria pomeroyi TaxID=89184 RepID=Q5LRT1_RUEPO|nr:hypothetical protein [Ruegeria pomeroyi]HCE69777.1 hypothetical protein [Ruegeria sp.]AAV95315.1 lipoprotein, putative [Ruegeria pomeroyi DSS-3]NVK95344.1 hypothetical protein [Ruegeria pomeroyi]NVL03721.1 hypothetical protein [Ruegeria pomeroyi]QWV08883.1 hypothetical protein KQ247_19125 [Ruegeria pomeroyi]